MKERSIIESTKIVIVTLVFVKIVGFIKQAVIAAYYGTSGDVDRFLLVSELMENLGVAIFSAIAISFVTLYVDIKNRKGEEGGAVLTSNIFVAFLPILIIAIVLVVLFSDQIAIIVAPGYSGADKILISQYIKLFSLTIINMFIFYLGNAVLEAEKQFFPGKIVGVIRSVSIILAVVVLSDKMGITALIIGTMVYYLLESVFILICVKRKMNFRLDKPFRDRNFIEILKLGWPLFISYGTVQIQSIVDKAIGSGLPEGSISALSYSGYLYNTTHSILIGGLCTVIFSYFTSYVAEKKETTLLNVLYKAIKILCIVLVFITVCYIGYAEDIVEIVYQRGEFGQESTNNVALAFIAYSVGLIFIGIRDVMIRAHYAYKDNKQAMINGIIGVCINIIASILLSKYLGFVGIALATSLSSMCIAMLSCYTVKKDVLEFKISSLGACFLKMSIAGGVLLVCVILLNKFVVIGNVFVDLFLKGLISIIIYIFLLKVLKVKEMDELENIFIRKLKHRKN